MLVRSVQSREFEQHDLERYKKRDSELVRHFREFELH